MLRSVRSRPCPAIWSATHNPSLAEQLAAAQEWWSEAGVDCAFTDQPIRWLRDEDPVETEQPAMQPPLVVAEPAPSPAPTLGGDPAEWPKDFGDFAAWWLSEPSLDTGGSRPRIAPRGGPGAKLMVLVPEPEAEDVDRLLSGAQGKLLASFFAAAGIAEDETYIAAVLPRHLPLPDWAALAVSGLGAVTLHHIELAAPARTPGLRRGHLAANRPQPSAKHCIFTKY